MWDPLVLTPVLLLLICATWIIKVSSVVDSVLMYMRSNNANIEDYSVHYWFLEYSSKQYSRTIACEMDQFAVKICNCNRQTHVLCAIFT